MLGAKNIFSSLAEAAREGNEKRVWKLLRKGADVDEPDHLGVMPLYHAARHGHKSIVRALLDHDADVNAPTPQGDTPLFRASQEGHLKIVEMLLDAGADPNKATGKGATPLMVACRKGHTKIATMLMQFRADPTAHTGQGLSVLYFAVDACKIELVQMLVRAGADVNELMPNGLTPLMIAAQNGEPEIAAFLIKSGADVNAQEGDNHALLLAVMKNRIELTRLLLDAGADINMKYMRTFTPWQLARKEGHDQLATILEEYEQQLKNGDFKLFDAVKSGDLDAVRAVIQADPESVNRRTALHEWTPLLLAVYTENEDMVELLLDHDADVNAANAEGKTPLHQAAGRGHIPIIKLLLSRKADPCIRYHGMTPIERARSKNRFDAVTLLLPYERSAQPVP